MNRGFVRSNWKKNACKSKDQSTTLYRYLSPQVAAIVHMQQLLTSSYNFYLRIYISTLSKSQVSEAQQVAQFPLHIWRQSR